MRIYLCFFLPFFSTAISFVHLQEKVLFIHVPKSGGVTVASLLMNEYTRDEIFNSDAGNIKLYAYGCHSSLFEIEKNINTSEFKLITFLRNPVDRILSEYRYCMERHRENPQILIAHRLPPQGNPIETASNVACKMLSGLDDHDPSIPIETHFAYAKKTLAEKLFFLGITEKMEESIHLLYSRLGWKIPEKITAFNKTDRDQHFSDEVLQAIAERNWADIALYETALILYDLQQHKTAPPTDSLPHLSDHYIDNYHYSFNQKLQGTGWGVRELNHDYRWATEQNEASIDFALENENNYDFHCTIFLQPILGNQFTVLVNDIPIYLVSNPPKDPNSVQYEWIQYRGTIPHETHNKREKTKIIFKMTPPTDPDLFQFYQEDNRQQDILINYIRGKFACSEIRICKSQ